MSMGSSMNLSSSISVSTVKMPLTPQTPCINGSMNIHEEM